jgi:hypothetical protein
MPRLSKIGAAALAAFGWTGLSSVTASYLVVAGGGGGSFGGAGAGGYQTGTASLNPTLSYSVTVGAGGAGQDSNSTVGSNGSNSVFNAITSTGGGGGGAATGTLTGSSGGSGGGGGNSGTGGAGTSGQGNAGGTGYTDSATYGIAGGGGGASAVGQTVNAGSSAGGNGGAGTASSISGSSVTYAGGGGGGGTTVGSRAGGSGGAGGGGAGTQTGSASSGTANTGGGGGGAGSATGNGGAGGSGVVIISYVGAQQFGGGIVTSSGGSTIHTFNTSGTLSPLNSLTANFLVVAGGAGGGEYWSGGGGGAGGLRSSVTNTGGGGTLESALFIDTNSTYLVTVGGGGAGAATGGSDTKGANGSNSAFLSITSTGGGAGGLYNNFNGNSGGSGGGGFYGGTGGAGTANQGFAGGAGASSGFGNESGGGGGGGAGAAGAAGAYAVAGNGGNGVAVAITGSSVTYAGGGGGSVYTGTGGTGGSGGGADGVANGGGNGKNGTANTGGGASGTATSTLIGGNGGSGVVIISYPGSTQQMAGGTVTVAGGNVIHTFTSSGYLAPIYSANNSLRFRASASAYLDRTFPSAGNRKTYTLSLWVKRGILGGSTSQFFFGSGVSTTAGGFYFTSTDQIEVNPRVNNTNTYLTTTQVFRDPSAWYHIVFALDTTQATDSNKMKLYVNGVQVTAFSAAVYPALNGDSTLNNNIAHWIGRYAEVGFPSPFDGYLAEYNFIDGQALTPNSFGTSNGLGVWQPIRYGGSYGTNGFYLPFNSGTSSFAGSFNGSSQYLNLTANSSLQFGTGDFTVEGWYYQNGTVSFGNIFSTTLLYTTTGGLRLSTGNSNNTFQVATAGSALINASVAFSASRWNHFAIVRSSGVTTLYQNGVSVGSASDSNSYTANTFVIGWVDGSGSSAYLLNGLLSNFRVVKGTAVYTSNFIPSTSPLTAITNTSLLTLQNSTIIDNSTNAFSITNNGTVTTGQTYPCSTAIFNDQSPQGNNWTPNNISGASGTTLDYMTDVPTLTSATAANTCTWNPLNGGTTGSSLTNGNLQLNGGTGWASYSATMAFPATGNYYCEITGVSVAGASQGTSVGILNPEYNLISYSDAIGNQPLGYGWYSYGGATYNNGSGTTYNGGATYTTGTVIGIQVNNGVLTFYKDGVSQGTAYSGITGSYVFAASCYGTDKVAINCGQRPFAYTPPTGSVRLNTFNLTTPTIGATSSTTANKYFDINLWTGNNANPRTLTGLSFQPDWVWLKDRSQATNHRLVDAVRGASKTLKSNTTDAETSSEVLGTITAFTSDGFTVQGTSNVDGVNLSGDAYVAWNWKANGTGSSNTAGSITSTVSANTTAGFSIVTYTGTGANATVGHGLGVAPSMVIVKRRPTAGSNWAVWHTGIANTEYLQLNSTIAKTTNTAFWNSTSPTSTVFSVGSDPDTNGTVAIVAYCFAQIAGYSAFGSYTGNGSTDGPFIYTGFRPRFVMIKLSSGSGSGWLIYDSSRNTYNLTDLYLQANQSNAEAGSSTDNPFDFLSNGFKARYSNSATNQSGGTFIYMAFAENPFKYANAR